MISEDRKNQLGCYGLILIVLAIVAIAIWLSFGMRSTPETSPAAANLAAPGDPTTGS